MDWRMADERGGAGGVIISISIPTYLPIHIPRVSTCFFLLFALLSFFLLFHPFSTYLASFVLFFSFFPSTKRPAAARPVVCLI
jgi:hypothetical protein